MQCEETATRTQDLPVTGGKTLPLAPGPPLKGPHLNKNIRSVPRIRFISFRDCHIFKKGKNGQITFLTLFSINSVKHPPDFSKY